MDVPTPAGVDLDALLGPAAQRSPDMEALWSWLAEQDAQVPDWLTLAPAEARALQNGLNARWNAELPDVEAAEPLTIPDVEAAEPLTIPDGPPATLIVPHGARPGCLLFLHGGGWSFGNLDTYARLMRLLAIATGLRVVGVDYRLAPEHPFPAPYDDCRAAWRWLAGRAEPAFAGPLALAGDSAGANLSLAVILDAIRGGGRWPDAGLLFYGAFAADDDTPSARRFAEGYGLTRAGMRRFWSWYAPDGGTDPAVSPLLAPEAEVARLPPLFLNAAGLDPLLCDTLALAGRLEAAGVPHRLVVHEGVHHGFMQASLRLPEAVAAIRQAAAFVDEATRR